MVSTLAKGRSNWSSVASRREYRIFYGISLGLYLQSQANRGTGRTGTSRPIVRASSFQVQWFHHTKPTPTCGYSFQDDRCICLDPAWELFILVYSNLADTYRYPGCVHANLRSATTQPSSSSRVETEPLKHPQQLTCRSPRNMQAVGSDFHVPVSNTLVRYSSICPCSQLRGPEAHYLLHLLHHLHIRDSFD